LGASIATWVIVAFCHRTIDGAGIKVASTKVETREAPVPLTGEEVL